MLKFTGTISHYACLRNVSLMVLSIFSVSITPKSVFAEFKADTWNYLLDIYAWVMHSNIRWTKVNSGFFLSHSSSSNKWRHDRCASQSKGIVLDLFVFLIHRQVQLVFSLKCFPYLLIFINFSCCHTHSSHYCNSLLFFLLLFLLI